MKEPVLFMKGATDKYCSIAEEMAEKIKAVIFEYEEQIPLVMALGVLRAVEIDITKD